MAELSSLELTAATAVVSTAVAVFSTMCPPMQDVLGSQSDTTRKMVSFGQNAGAVATVSVGLVLSWITRSPMPAVFGIGISMLVMFAYEYAFRRAV
ncbi:hypothetical protein Toil_gp27 [Rhodococcus phage Toil]|uniref:Uncharacterized protein n=1 Tax=Rhodococcus phage Toil TaxID=1975614 RepID=A0A1W6DXI1_9VIRU|nr:hypothetical protein KMD62_gp27 [Rhodococcus phage Toil]ARK07710.1 hypothetical protein Toil_gp27 [Rhodococcus phage Toil]